MVHGHTCSLLAARLRQLSLVATLLLSLELALLRELRSKLAIELLLPREF